MRRDRLTRRLLVTAALGAMAALLGYPADAASVTVTNGSDSGAGSLRDAIASSSAGDTINLSPGLNTVLTLGSDLTVGQSLTFDFTATSGILTIAGPHGIAFTSGSTSLDSLPSNAYTGTTSLQAGTLSIVGTGGWAAYQSQLAMSAGTTLNVSTTPVSGLAQGATFASLAGTGTINLSAPNQLELTGNDQTSTTFSGAINGAGGITLLGGGGTLTLTNPTPFSNNYSGATNIFALVIVGSPPGLPFTATLAAGAADVFSPNSRVEMAGNAVLALNNFDQRIGSLDGQGTVLLGSSSFNTLAVGNDNTSSTFFGLGALGGITGSGNLIKEGTGTFTLDSSFGPAATYTGTTDVGGGVLQAASSMPSRPTRPSSFLAARDSTSTDSTILSPDCLASAR